MLRKSAIATCLLLFSSLSVLSATLPKHTKLTVENETWLNSERSLTGESFEAKLTKDVLVDGKIVVPKGTTVRGTIAEAQSSQVGAPGVLRLELDSIELNGHHPIGTSEVTRYGRSAARQGDNIENRRAAADQMAGVIHDSVHGTPNPVPTVTAGRGLEKSDTEQVDIPPGTELTFTLRTPVEINPEDDKDKN